MIAPIVVENRPFPLARLLAVATLVAVVGASVGLFTATRGDGASPATVLTHEPARHRSVGRLAMLPDGRLLAAEGFDTAAWDLATGTAVVYPVFSSGTAVAVLPDGRIASTGTDDTVFVWSTDEIPDAGATRRYRGHPRGARDLAVIAPDRVLSVGAGQLRVWDVDTLHTEVVVGDATFDPQAVVALGDGRFAIGEWGGTIRTWSPDRPDDLPILAHAGGASGAAVTAIGAFPDGRIAVGTDDGAVRIVDADGDVVDVGRIDSEVASLLVLADGRIATGWFDHRVRIWDPADPDAEPVVLRGHERVVGAMVQLPDGRLATGGNDGSIRIWDVTG